MPRNGMCSKFHTPVKRNDVASMEILLRLLTSVRYEFVWKTDLYRRIKIILIEKLSKQWNRLSAFSSSSSSLSLLLPKLWTMPRYRVLLDPKYNKLDNYVSSILGFSLLFNVDFSQVLLWLLRYLSHPRFRKSKSTSHFLPFFTCVMIDDSPSLFDCIENWSTAVPVRSPV